MLIHLAATIAFHGNVRHSLTLGFLLVLRAPCPPTPLLSLRSVFTSTSDIATAKIITINNEVKCGGVEVVRVRSGGVVD